MAKIDIPQSPNRHISREIQGCLVAVAGLHDITYMWCCLCVDLSYRALLYRMLDALTYIGSDTSRCMAAQLRSSPMFFFSIIQPAPYGGYEM